MNDTFDISTFSEIGVIVAERDLRVASDPLDILKTLEMFE